MTWEELIGRGIVLEKVSAEQLDTDRDILQAFATELIKRLDRDVTYVYQVPRTMFPSILNELLTECGIKGWTYDNSRRVRPSGE